jgi:hypothetical protein
LTKKEVKQAKAFVPTVPISSQVGQTKVYFQSSSDEEKKVL